MTPVDLPATGPIEFEEPEYVLTKPLPKEIRSGGKEFHCESLAWAFAQGAPKGDVSPGFFFDEDKCWLESKVDIDSRDVPIYDDLMNENFKAEPYPVFSVTLEAW